VSIELYQTRLYWDGARGAAKDRGVTIVLHAPPVLPGLAGLAIEMIDFAPYVVAEIMPAREGRRLMTRQEIEAVEALLREVTA
jgi:hypothetical protein